MEMAFVAIAILVAALLLYNGMIGMANANFEAQIRSAMIANFSRYGFDKDAKFVIVDDERAYFMHNDAVWRCDVVDDLPMRETAKPVDLMQVNRDELKEVMAVVDIMNGVEDDDE